MISICIITKNEAQHLRNCLNALTPFGYEIIVVDTGSADASKAVAAEYTDKIYDFSWCDDFSKARNYAIEKAGNEFIFMVDSDEIVTKLDKVKLEKLLLSHPQKVGRITRDNLFSRNEIGFSNVEFVNRIFSKKYFRYKGKIHEQVTALNQNTYETFHAPIWMEHTGYDGDLEIRKKKTTRNIKLLFEALREDGEDPYLYYQLGKSYYMQTDYKKASEFFGKALEFDLDTRLEYVIDLVESYGYALINSDQVAEALLLSNVYEEFSHSADFVFLMGFVYMQNGIFDRAVEEFLKATGYKECKLRGVNSYLAYYNAGVIEECLGNKGSALSFYNKCDDYPLAMEGIIRCTNHS